MKSEMDEKVGILFALCRGWSDRGRHFFLKNGHGGT